MTRGAQTQNDRRSSFCLQRWSYLLYRRCCIPNMNQASKNHLQTIVSFSKDIISISYLVHILSEDLKPQNPFLCPLTYPKIPSKLVEACQRTSKAFNAVSTQHCFKVSSPKGWEPHLCQAILMTRGAQTQNDRRSSFCLQRWSYLLYRRCCIPNMNQASKNRLQTIVSF